MNKEQLINNIFELDNIKDILYIQERLYNYKCFYAKSKRDDYNSRLVFKRYDNWKNFLKENNYTKDKVLNVKNLHKVLELTDEEILKLVKIKLEGNNE